MRELLPYRVRSTVDRLWRPIVFERAMRRFLRAPEACEDPACPLLGQLAYGWGNAAWSARPDYLAACLRRAARADGPVLECGSGLSTLLVGHVAASRGRPYLALEHDAEWANKVRDALERYRIAGVEVRHAPLVDSGTTLWYEVREPMPATFALALCDGPPGHGKGGRSGLVERLRERLVPGTVLLVDDYAREAEQRMVSEWSAVLPAAVTDVAEDRQFAELTVQEAAPAPAGSGSSH